MSDARRYAVWSDPVQGQGHEPFKFGKPSIFKRYLLRYLQRELATDDGFLNYGFLGRLLWVKLITLVVLKCSSVRTYVCPQKVFLSISMKFGM